MKVVRNAGRFCLPLYLSAILNAYRVVPGIRNHGLGPSQRVFKLTQMKSEPSQPVSSKRGL